MKILSRQLTPELHAEVQLIGKRIERMRLAQGSMVLILQGNEAVAIQAYMEALRTVPDELPLLTEDCQP